MKKTIITGEIKKELEILLKEVDSKKSAINALSYSLFTSEQNMWQFVKNEFPEISENASLKMEDKDLILTDYNAKI